MQNAKTVYIVIFADRAKKDVRVIGLEALARFEANEVYFVKAEGRELTDLELTEWERLSDLYWSSGVILPVGFNG